MGHGVGPYLSLDEIGSPSPIMIFYLILVIYLIVLCRIYLLRFL